MIVEIFKRILFRFKDRQFFKKILAISLLSAVCLAIQALAVFYFSALPLPLRILSVLLMSVINIGGVLFGYLEKKPLFRMVVSFVSIIAFLMAFYVALNLTGFFKRFSSFDAVKNFILSTGKWAKIIYVLLVIVQIIFLPIPSAILEVAAANLFGSLTAFLLSIVGMLIGSSIAYFIGRALGRRVVNWIAGKENVDKYILKFNESGKFIFAVMMLFPLFPDDIICMVAGLSSIPFWFFFLTILLARPFSSAVNCFLGSGDIVPFQGWGIPVWIAIALIILLCFYLVMKLQNKKDEYKKLCENIKNGEISYCEKQKSSPRLITNPNIINDPKVFENIKRHAKKQSKTNNKK